MGEIELCALGSWIVCKWGQGGISFSFALGAPLMVGALVWLTTPQGSSDHNEKRLGRLAYHGGAALSFWRTGCVGHILSVDGGSVRGDV